MASPSQVDSDDEVFWGPLTLKEIKASLKIAHKLGQRRSIEAEAQRLEEENNGIANSSTDQKKNGLCSEETENGNLDLSSARNQTEIKSPNKFEASCISSTPRKRMNINSKNDSEESEKALCNVTPQTTPVKENGTSTYTTPSLLSPSRDDSNSSFASVGSSFIDESESPTVDVVSESFEKVDPKKYNFRNVNNLSGLNLITNCHLESEVSQESEMDSNFNRITPASCNSSSKLNESVVKLISSEEILNSICETRTHSTKIRTSFSASVVPECEPNGVTSEIMSHTPFRLVNESNITSLDLTHSEKSRKDGNQLSLRSEFQPVQEVNKSPEGSNSTLNEQKVPIVVSSWTSVNDQSSKCNITSYAPEMSEKSPDSLKTDLEIISDSKITCNIPVLNEKMKTSSMKELCDLANIFRPRTAPENEDVSTNCAIFETCSSPRPFDFSQLTEANISCESPPNLTVLDNTVMSVNQSRLSLLPLDRNSKPDKKIVKSVNNVPIITENPLPKKKFFSNLLTPKVYAVKAVKSAATPTKKLTLQSTPLIKEPKKTGIGVPVASSTKSNLLPSLGQRTIGKVTPCQQKTPMKNQIITSVQKKKFFSTPQSVKSLKDSKLKQGMSKVCTDSKFDRLSPSNTYSSTTVPNSSIPSKPNGDSNEKFKSEPKKKFFTSSQYSKIPLGCVKSEPKVNINPSRPLKSLKFNSTLTPSKFAPSKNYSPSLVRNALSKSEIRATSVPKYFPRDGKNTVQNQENVSNRTPKYEDLETSVAKYSSDSSLPLSDASFNSSLNSNKPLLSRIPTQKSLKGGTRLPRFYDTSKILKTNFTSCEKTGRQ